MIRPIVLVWIALPVAAASAKPPPKWIPHPIHIVPGVPLLPEDIKPYAPPRLSPEPPLEPSDVKVIEVSAPEAVIEIRPWSSPMVGNAVKGARLPVKGVVKTTRGGCSSHVWYALEPFGYVCGREANPTDQPATTEQVLTVRPGSRLPFQYVMMLIKEGDKIPMWATIQDLKMGAEPERQLEKGDTVAIEKPFIWDDTKYWISVEGKVLPQKGAALMGGGSEWHGIELTAETPLPFGWITADQANVYDAPPESRSHKPISQIERRTRVRILDEQLVHRRKYLKVAVAEAAPPKTSGNIIADVEPAKKKNAAPPLPPVAPPAVIPPALAPPLASPETEMWVAADAVNEVRLLAPPKTIPAGVTKWIDVDLGEQVLVAYEGERPVFATLVSSGRAIATPMGTYPVWAKVSAISMKNQPYEDKGYYVHKVPWSTFFQWHNAIHGAYWHDRFGVSKSHGCVNVAPLDARHVFEWVTPPLPPGWTGLRPLELLQSPTVVVRNSHLKQQFRQDRPIGPPDRELEGQRLEEAEARRAADAQAILTAPPVPLMDDPGSPASQALPLPAAAAPATAPPATAPPATAPPATAPPATAKP